MGDGFRLQVRLERVEEQLEHLVARFANALGEPLPPLVNPPPPVDGDAPVGEEDIDIEVEEAEEESGEDEGKKMR